MFDSSQYKDHSHPLTPTGIKGINYADRNSPINESILKEKSVFLPISYSVKEIGLLIKATTKRVRWIFSIGTRQYYVDLIHTLLTGKRELFVNGRFLFETQS